MSTNDLIANQIEVVIEKMFTYFSSIDSGATQYSIFYNPKRSSSWFIAIFFQDANLLNESLKNGVCYQMHTYLNVELNNLSETSQISRSIYFEPGVRPTGDNEVDELFNIFLKRQIPSEEIAENESDEKCGVCGHNFNNHQLLCNLKNDGDTPQEGWIVCPVENCNCFQTWNANYDPAN